MTAHRWPTVHICSCGRLRQEHYFTEADKAHLRPRGTDDGRCVGYVEARVEERPPAAVLRARLEAVAALHHRVGDSCAVCREPDGEPQAWPCPTVRAARGET